MKRKQVTVLYDIKRKNQDLVYRDAYEREIGRGACSLFADLTAWVNVAWTFCQCDKCGGFAEAPKRLEEMVPETHRWFPWNYVWQHLPPGKCRTADELQRLEKIYYGPRNQAMGVAGRLYRK